jgi:hypothetical protein
MEADILVRFISGFYTFDDWNFFCRLRHVLKPVLGYSVRGQKLLTLNECIDFCDNLRDGSVTIDPVIKILEDDIKSTCSRDATDDGTIDGNYFLYICLWVYHHQTGRGHDVMTSSFMSTGAGRCERSSPLGNRTSVIDSYIDSIIQLKKETRKISKNIVRDSVQMEEVVNRILADCCLQVSGDQQEQVVGVAEELMTAVMNGDEGLWGIVHKTRGDVKYTIDEFKKCLEFRDRLLEAVRAESSGDIVEEALYQFCMSIAKVPLLQLVTRRSVDEARVSHGGG